MELRNKSRMTHWILSGGTAGALALFGVVIGCSTGSAPEPTSIVELEAVNSCNEGDTSRTIAAAVTCTLNVDTSANDGAAITAGPPYKEDGKWRASCYLSGIKCGGARVKTPLSCPPPEYLATNQDVNCTGRWTKDLKGHQGAAVVYDDTYVQPSAERTLQACTSEYGHLMNDLNAKANAMCNAFATDVTSNSKKAAVCCKKVPKPDGGTCLRRGISGLCEEVDAGVPEPDAETPDAEPEDGGIGDEGGDDGIDHSDGGIGGGSDGGIGGGSDGGIGGGSDGGVGGGSDGGIGGGGPIADAHVGEALRSTPRR